MKNKLIEERFNRDKGRVLNTFNNLIFTEESEIKLKPKQTVTFKEIAEKVSIAFFKSFQKFNVLGLSGPHTYFTLDVKEKPMKNILEEYSKFFAMFCPTHSAGFTPRLAQEFGGYNCFGKAMVFGMYATQHKINVELVFSPDHVMCHCFDKDSSYLCDPESGKIWEMNGMICCHQGYGMYRKSPRDTFRYNYLVVGSMIYGGLHTIVKTFRFLKETPWDHRNIHLKDNNFYEIEMLTTVMSPKKSFRNHIQHIDWKNLDERLFNGFENYHEDYRTEWALEHAMMRNWRSTQKLQTLFDDACFAAIRATRFTGTVKEFNEHYIPIMKSMGQYVVTFLDSGEKLFTDINETVEIYLKVLKDHCDKDPVLKAYALEMVRPKSRHVDKKLEYC